MMKIMISLLVTILMLLSSVVYAESPEEVATAYVGKSVFELMQVMGQPYTVQNELDGQGVYSYHGFTVYTQNTTITGVRETDDIDLNAGWKKEKGYMFYQNQKGFVLIDGKTYDFDRQGRQRTGWIKRGKDYYYFQIANGRNGFMLTDRTISGIRLDHEGKAKGPAKKLELLVLINNYVFKQAKPTLSKYQRYKQCYHGVIKTFRYGGVKKFHQKDWSVYYGLRMIKRRKEVCWGYGSVLAYMAKACGYQNVQAQCTKRHGWAYVDGKYVDGSYGASNKSDHWFMFKATKHTHTYPDDAYKRPTDRVKI